MDDIDETASVASLASILSARNALLRGTVRVRRARPCCSLGSFT
jgi:hypothetical protein